MNIIEAVKVLSKGNCEAVKLTIDGNGICIINNSKPFTEVNICICDILAEDWELVNPITQYEEVEVSAICEVNPQGQVTIIVPSTEQIKLYPGNQLVKLTGTIKREVKPKLIVKHREQVGLNTLFTSVPMNAKLYAEWEEEL